MYTLLQFTNRKEFLLNILPFGIIPIGITYSVITGKDSGWFLISIMVLSFYFFSEAIINSYISFEFKDRTMIVSVPFGKYSLLWKNAPKSITIEPDKWDELHIEYVYFKGGNKIMRRTFYFMKDGEFAFHFSTFVNDRVERELLERCPEKKHKILTKNYPYKMLESFTQQNRDKVL
jgi:hypothetical protein